MIFLLVPQEGCDLPLGAAGGLCLPLGAAGGLPLGAAGGLRSSSLCCRRAVIFLLVPQEGCDLPLGATGGLRSLNVTLSGLFSWFYLLRKTF